MRFSQCDDEATNERLRWLNDGDLSKMKGGCAVEQVQLLRAMAPRWDVTPVTPELMFETREFWRQKDCARSLWVAYRPQQLHIALASRVETIFDWPQP